MRPYVVAILTEADGSSHAGGWQHTVLLSVGLPTVMLSMLAQRDGVGGSMRTDSISLPTLHVGWQMHRSA